MIKFIAISSTFSTRPGNFLMQSTNSALSPRQIHQEQEDYLRLQNDCF
jgi:hypothetical protein